jgi:4'-phosphopantetheinyl transferase
LRGCRALLDEEEQARSQRYRRVEDRNLYVLSHALLRSTLSHYANVQPARWRFRPGGHGRPEIDQPAAWRRLRFSLSHTARLAACVVTETIDCGIDVESTARARDLQRIAAHVLTADELASMEGLAPEAERRQFFRLWTLKEAYLKARGEGLLIEPPLLSFRLDGAAPMAHFAGDLRDLPEHWQFASCAPTEQHIMAVALRIGSSPARPVVVGEMAQAASPESARPLAPRRARGSANPC